MWRSELRAVRNTWRTAPGRRALLSSAIVLVCLALAGLMLGGMLSRPELVAALRDEASERRPLLALLCAVLLMPPVLLVLAFAKVPIKQELFVGARVPALLCSPVGVWRIVTTVWLRQSAIAGLSALAVVTAPAFALVLRAQLPISVAFALLATAVMLVALVVAAVMLWLVAAVRWGSGGRLRQVLTVLHVVFATLVILLLMSGVGRGSGVSEVLRSYQPNASSLGSLVAVVSAMPIAFAGGGLTAVSIAAPSSAIAIAMLCLGLVSASYRPAFEAWLCAAPARVVVRRGRAWPASAVASLLRRSMLESWRARGNLALLALLAAYTVWQVVSSELSAPPNDPTPTLRAVFFLLLPWQLLASLMSMLLFLGVVGDDQRQLSLLATSPLSRGDLLKSRLVLVGWPFVLILVLTASSSPLVVGVSWSATCGFVLVAVPVLLVLLASTLVVGSWPRFIAVHDQLPLASNLRSVVPVLVLAVISGVALYGHYAARDLLLHHEPAAAPWLAVAAWLIGCAVFSLGCRIARGNLERLLGPR